MSWNFAGKVTRQEFFPSRSYSLKATHFFYNPSGVTPDWLSAADCCVSVLDVENSINILKDYGVGAEHVVQSGQLQDEGVCWVRYDEQTGGLDAVLGLRGTAYDAAKPALDLSFEDPSLSLQIAVEGGFSLFEDNLHSISPTLDQFQRGAPAPLGNAPRIWMERRDKE